VFHKVTIIWQQNPENWNF